MNDYIYVANMIEIRNFFFIFLVSMLLLIILTWLFTGIFFGIYFGKQPKLIKK